MTDKLDTQNIWQNQSSWSKANMQQAHDTQSRVTYLKGSVIAIPDVLFSGFLTAIALIGKVITLGYVSSIDRFYTQEKHHVATGLTALPIGLLGTIHPKIAEKTAPEWLIKQEDVFSPKKPKRTKKRTPSPQQRPTDSAWSPDQYAYLLELHQAYTLAESGEKRSSPPPQSAQARSAGRGDMGLWDLYLRTDLV